MLSEATWLYIARSIKPPYSINLEVKDLQSLIYSTGQFFISFNEDDSHNVAHPANAGFAVIFIDVQNLYIGPCI